MIEEARRFQERFEKRIHSKKNDKQLKIMYFAIIFICMFIWYLQFAADLRDLLWAVAGIMGCVILIIWLLPTTQ